MAVNLFTGATNNNWGTATNWSQGTVPTASDGHVTTFDATSPNCTVNASVRACNHLDFTGYTNTITMSVGLTVSGNLTMISTMSSRVAGTATLIINAPGTPVTITSNGGTWPSPFTFSGTNTYTLADTMTLSGACAFSTSSAIFTINGFTLNLNGTVTNSGSTTIQGTTKLVIGSVSFLSSAITIKTDLDFNGNVNIAGTLTIGGGTFRIVSGIVTNPSFTINTATTTLDLSTQIWTTITTIGANTITLNSALTVTTIAHGSGGNITWSGSFGITCTNYNLSSPPTSPRTYTFAANVTYIFSNINFIATDTDKVTWVSSHATNKAIITVPNTGTPTIDLAFINATRIDSSNGATIWSRKGTLTSTLNWNLLVAQNNYAHRN